MRKSILLLLLIVMCPFHSIMAQRLDSIINDNWSFRFSHNVQSNINHRVDLPHTWNTQDALAGKVDYKRGIGNYTKRIVIPKQIANRRLFLRFEGANSVCDVFVNGKFIGEHRGGYGAFIFEITNAVKYGSENELLVRVSNAERLDVMPLVGDFNFYGGLYRDVHLISTSDICISPLDYASPGVYLIQKKVTNSEADVQTRILLSNSGHSDRSIKIKVDVFDNGKRVLSKDKDVVVGAQVINHSENIDFSLNHPHLWNGRQDPFMYTAVVSLIEDGKEIDRIEQPLGLRYYHTDPDKGFFLNGNHLALHGVCRHQERAEIGNALRPEHHEEDVSLMLEMGVNAVRLAHYPQSSYMYDLTDKYGIVAWAEIPFVGPGGYGDKGFVDMESFKENGKEQLREMIRQHFNHPSICFWGLFNELKENGDNPISYIKELNDIAHQEDSTRPTTAASNQGGNMNYITDNIAWNRYDGWYGRSFEPLATFLDDMHKKRPSLKIAISEYGAGASINQQQDSLVQPTPNSMWHPENWQTYYHIKNWEMLCSRPFLWGTFIWNMFDFGAAHRTEGDRIGINDKGLVTHDRKVRKDAFFFYKVNWNPTPMIYIVGRRDTLHKHPLTDIQVFSNVPQVTLKVNGKVISSARSNSLHIALFKDVSLSKGTNTIEVLAKAKGAQLHDRVMWTLE